MTETPPVHPDLLAHRKALTTLVLPGQELEIADLRIQFSMGGLLYFFETFLRL
ncbi:MAG: hypothetical protein JJU29_15950 [Verrucomicrobia bacterium]|nr:hypothetical protein [Verrucomicrobiota bacterium]MCH8514062.1 hypothetical protein [Kiritimatiellia bacterium]